MSKKAMANGVLQSLYKQSLEIGGIAVAPGTDFSNHQVITSQDQEQWQYVSQGLYKSLSMVSGEIRQHSREEQEKRDPASLCTKYYTL